MLVPNQTEHKIELRVDLHLPETGLPLSRYPKSIRYWGKRLSQNWYKWRDSNPHRPDWKSGILDLLDDTCIKLCASDLSIDLTVSLVSFPIACANTYNQSSPAGRVLLTYRVGIERHISRLFGGTSRQRSDNLLVKSQVLCQLSYGPKIWCTLTPHLRNGI